MTWMNSSLQSVEAYRGSILHFVADPNEVGEFSSYAFFEDGILLVDEGKIVGVDHADKVLPTLSQETVVRVYEEALILPGLIDTHIHFPQTDMIAAYGEQLLEWLDKYTFPNEKRFFDKEYSDLIAEKFLDELLKNGTTTALVFGAAAVQSVESLFAKAESLNMRIIAGQSLGDRNLLEQLLGTPENDYKVCKELIGRWHRRGRLHYAMTPRFAPTSTEEHLKMVKRVLNEHPDVYLHTHLSENRKEVEWVQTLFPWSQNYLDVYDRFGLVKEKALFAHAIHLEDSEYACLSKQGASVSFCPTSNLFLGSGLFNYQKACDHGVKIGIGTDVGAGTTFSIVHTLGECYKVAQLQQQRFNPFEAFYHATLGGARALSLDHLIGNFEQGKEADFVVLDLKATPLLSFRMNNTRDLLDRLFLLMILGDDRAVKATYIYGKQQYQK